MMQGQANIKSNIFSFAYEISFPTNITLAIPDRHWHK